MPGIRVNGAVNQTRINQVINSVLVGAYGRHSHLNRGIGITTNAVQKTINTAVKQYTSALLILLIKQRSAAVSAIEKQAVEARDGSRPKNIISTCCFSNDSAFIQKRRIVRNCVWLNARRK
ncbi:Uncharacterised protein [Klebsiella pneumoniae]|nr:Uncharacterised protein [Klebsiella pneumoniae]